MTKSHSKAYAEAGVNIEAGYEGVALMKEHVQKTWIPGVLSDIGGFGGLFHPDLSTMEDPVFVSGTDGVGTKIRIAQLLGIHNTIGVDCVAMCANDIVCCGAKPLFFLDYLAIGKNDPKKVVSIVSGVADGCQEVGCALIGGETAEHPGIMQEEDYDLAGFCVGVVEQKNIIQQDSMKEGDVLIALPSSGLHSNGFSLVRKVFDIEHCDLNEMVEVLGKSLGEELLTPTKLYVQPVLKVLEVAEVHGISHITGGGFYENVPRMVKDGLCASIQKDKIKVLPIFTYLQEKGQIDEHDMFNTFNMGVGMVIAVSKETKDIAIQTLQGCGVEAYEIGEVIQGKEKIALW